MRLTVGPLPPAVYWRRRAVIAGAVLAAVLVIAYSCSTASTIGDRAATDGKSSPPAAATGSPAPSPSVLGPSSEDPVAPPRPPDVGAANPGAGTHTGNAATGTCGDSELSLVPQPEIASVRQGVPMKFMLKIKNVSSRTCVRDVGANMQELYLQEGTAKQWSSDLCVKRTGNDVVTFPPNHEVSYYLIWDGKTTAAGCTNQPWLAKGTYQLVGRLGTKASDPVTFTVTG